MAAKLVRDHTQQGQFWGTVPSTVAQHSSKFKRKKPKRQKATQNKREGRKGLQERLGDRSTGSSGVPEAACAREGEPAAYPTHSYVLLSLQNRDAFAF